MIHILHNPCYLQWRYQVSLSSHIWYHTHFGRKVWQEGLGRVIYNYYESDIKLQCNKHLNSISDLKSLKLFENQCSSDNLCRSHIFILHENISQKFSNEAKTRNPDLDQERTVNVMMRPHCYSIKCRTPISPKDIACIKFASQICRVAKKYFQPENFTVEGRQLPIITNCFSIELKHLNDAQIQEYIWLLPSCADAFWSVTCISRVDISSEQNQ